MYSILPCPKGCSASAGLSESLNPTIVIIEEPASDKLLKASAIIAILEVISPTESFIRKRRRLESIPTIPPRKIYLPLTFSLDISSLFLMNLYTRNFENIKFKHSLNIE